MQGHINDMRFLSDPVDLYWMGWKTDTATLMKHGWQLSSWQDVQYQNMMIAIQYKLDNGQKIQGVSQNTGFDYHPRTLQTREIKPHTGITMELSNQIFMNSTSPDWTAIDAEPSMTYEKIHNLEDMVHFKKIPNNTTDILLKKASLEQVLHFALQKQESRQVEIRHEMIEREKLEQYKRDSTIRAQLRLVV